MYINEYIIYNSIYNILFMKNSNLSCFYLFFYVTLRWSLSIYRNY